MSELRRQPPSGAQWAISHGAQRAVVVEVGGGLRTYEVDGLAVLDGYPLEAVADGGRGQPLLPWPNRIANGHYSFAGQEHQLPIDEVARNNAIHGLMRWVNWTPIDQATDSITIGQTIHPRPGYPFTLDIRIRYTLDDNGLTVRTRASNVGSQTLPFGAGQHPYFTIGSALVDDVVLQLPAATHIALDPERRLPTGEQTSVHGTQCDFTVPRAIGDLHIDDCFTGLRRDTDGRARATLSGADSRRRVSVWMAEPYRWLQVFTGDTLAPARRRRGIAIEPMTCPPDAFRSGIDVLVLEPGQAVELEWGIEAYT